MILFHAKANGQVTTTPSLVPQGSSMQDLVVMSELDYALCTIRLEPASGVYIPDVVCTFVKTERNTTVWTAKLPPEATVTAGKVTYSLEFTAADGSTLTTEVGTFDVPKRARAVMPETVGELESRSIQDMYQLLADIFASTSGLDVDVDMLKKLKSVSGSITIPTSEWSDSNPYTAFISLGSDVLYKGCIVFVLPENDATKIAASESRLSMVIDQTGDYTDPIPDFVMIARAESGVAPMIPLNFRFIVLKTGTEDKALVAMIGVDAVGEGGTGGSGGTGANGKDGVGIAAVEQTTTSTEDSGINVVTMTDTEGKEYTFTVRNGSKGSKGDTGAQGIQGVQGIQGEKGNDGATGAKGEQGEKGEKGDRGDPFSVAKVYATIEEMEAGYATDGVGIGQFVIIDTGDAADEENARLYVKGETAYSYITDLSGMPGIQGPQGEKGETGAKGEQGEKGEKGDQGIQGVQGEQGPQGEKGDTGAQGPQGDQGIQGNQGLTGKSAYQSALDSGFEGTEAEWVETLETGSGVAKKTRKTERYVTPGFTSPESDDVVLIPLSGFIDSTGAQQASSGYVCTDYIRINKTTKISYHALSYKTMCTYAFYDGAMNFLSGLITTASSVTSISGTLDEVPDGAEFVRLTMKETASDQYATVTTTIVNPNDPSALTLPDYWETYLPAKIDTIKALQTAGGKDAVCFIVLTDIHFGSDGYGYRGNQGWSPMLIKRIADECHIKYVLNLGDVFDRHANNQNKESAYRELALVKEMLVPIKDRMLITRGNHDVAYEGSKMTNNFTPEEVHEWFFRPLCLLNGVHFDDSGTGYYVDDTAEKIRYVVLNTQNLPGTLTEDGYPKYPTNGKSRFTQSQFDLVLEALMGIPSNAWSVVMASHVPIAGDYGPSSYEGEDAVMRGMLEAYRNKTIYQGTFKGTMGTAEEEVELPYTNLSVTVKEDGTSNIADSSNPPTVSNDTRWWDGYRFSASSGAVKESTGYVASNTIAIKDSSGNALVGSGKYLHVKGLNLKSSFTAYLYKSDGTYLSNSGEAASNSAIVVSSYDDDVILIPPSFLYDNANTYYVKLYSTLMDGYTIEDVVITIDEEIVEVEQPEQSEKNYDYVTVDADFTDAKGDIIAWISGHTHMDLELTADDWSIKTISNRADACIDNVGGTRGVRGTTTEQSFNVYVVNKKTRQIQITKIGAGSDRTISY